MIWIVLTVAVLLALVVALIVLLRTLRRSKTAKGIVTPLHAMDVPSGRFITGAEPYQGQLYGTLLTDARTGKPMRAQAPCRIRFWDMDAKCAFAVSFPQQLILGRGNPGEMHNGLAGISTSAHVSHQQYLLNLHNKKLYLRNISKNVLPTVNGAPLNREVPLQVGMVLEAGGVRLQVQAISQGNR